MILQGQALQVVDAQQVTCYITSNMLLTRRTNILFSEPDYRMLKTLSEYRNQTIGEYVRQVVTTSFKKHKTKTTSTAKLFQKMRNLAKDMNTKGLNIKELVEDGRRY